MASRKNSRLPLPVFGVFRRWIGHLAVSILNILGRLPSRLVLAFGTLPLLLYVPFRRKTRARLKRLSPPVPALAYYRMRLRLALLSLRHHLGKPDGCTLTVEGAELHAGALDSGKPVVLLGWHQGPVELLHRLPAACGDAGAFFVMTASAFSPALAAWMARGRASQGTAIIRPGDTDALRAWVRSRGVLAVMIDQVPGEPEDWVSLQNEKITLPWPRRLVDWIAAQEPVFLAVSVRWGPGDRIVFRYDRLEAGALKRDTARLMEAAIARAPGQYNWSYGKITVGS